MPATTDHRTPAQHNAWERSLPVWHLLFGLLLIVTTALTLADPDRSAAPAPVLGVSVLLGAWYGVFVIVGTERIARRPVLWLLFGFMGWLLWYILSGFTMITMLLLFALFPHLFIYLPLPWAGVGAIALNALIIIRLSDMGDLFSATWILFTFGGSAAGIALAYFIDGVIRQSQERRDLITQLEAARAELNRAEREAGVLQERQRLAHEIHDTLVQGFISIVTHLEAAEEAAATNTEIAERHIAQAKDAARANLTEARRFVWALRPAALDVTASIDEALRLVVESWSAAHHVQAQFVLTGAPVALVEHTQTALLRVTQEALSNIARHAEASSATVTLSFAGDVVLLDIQDNGVGFSPEQAMRDGHYGLRGMRERVEAAGGTLTIEAGANGTIIAAELPIGTKRKLITGGTLRG